MVEQPVQVPRAGPDPVPTLEAYLRPFAPLFRHPQSRPTWASVERYVTGLLTDLPRKNCDTIAAAVAGTTTERLQHLLTDADWDPLALDAARVRRLVALSPAGGVLVLDDTGLPKQGRASAGVARQYSGTLGKVANCQVVVSAQYVEDAPTTGTPLHWPVSAQLYLHQTWAGDAAADRRKRAHVPADVAFRTKPAIALALVDRARAWGVPFRHVVADAGWYGVRAWIEQGFKVTKRGGWPWHRTRMTDPDRAARLWLAVAVATLWLLSVGGEADATVPESTLLAVTTTLATRRQRQATRLRLVSVFRRGLTLIWVALLHRTPLPTGHFVPEPWPTIVLVRSDPAARPHFTSPAHEAA